MKVIVERATKASVSIHGAVVGEITRGFLLLVGFTHSDTPETVEKMANKILNLRIMADENDRMNLTLTDTNGAILAVPQFTLYADTSGRRPGFKSAAAPDIANSLFEHFVATLKASAIQIETGTFGAHMVVSSENDGPLTLILED